MKIIRQASYVASPWKNGAGVTHEVMRVPAEAGAFRWRVSVARIDGSGPFSDFAGYRRTMVLLRGAGLSLEFDGRESRSLAAVGDLVEFDGASSVQCTLRQGPCTDLNLMVAEGAIRVQTTVRRLAPAWTAAASGIRLVFPITGQVHVSAGGEDGLLEEWDFAVVSHGEPLVAASPSGHPAGLVFLATLTDN